MIGNRVNSPRFCRWARLILAVLLLAGLASTAAPLITNASGTLCKLSCCAGRAPHAAGSCMNGACHTFLRKSQSGRLHVRPQVEHFCGLPRFEKTAQSSIARVRTNPGPEPIEFRGALTTPCEADCGACGVAFASFYRGHDFAIAAYKLQPLSAWRCSDFGAASIPTFSAPCDRCAPRGPPKTFA